MLLAARLPAGAGEISADELFRAGVEAYRTGEFTVAAKAFQQSSARQPAAGTFQNLGNAEWQRGRTGPAILAWEKTLWLNPSAGEARNNLRFARASAQIEAPELAWYEIVSAWLPANAWAWLTALSVWLVAAVLTLPLVLRRRRTVWQQALAAVAITLGLLSIPAHFGLSARGRIGIVLQPETPLRLTPTAEAEEITKLGAGDPVRCRRVRGDYVFVQLSHGAGWVARAEIGLICPGPKETKN